MRRNRKCSPHLCIFPDKPLCPRATVISSSPADEMMYPSLEIIGTRWLQPSQNISFFNCFSISSTLGCISLGYFLILRIVKIIFWELWHHRKTEKFSGIYGVYSLTFFRINKLYICLLLLKGWVGRGQSMFTYSSVCTSYGLGYGALWFLMFFSVIGLLISLKLWTRSSDKFLYTDFIHTLGESQSPRCLFMGPLRIHEPVMSLIHITCCANRFIMCWIKWLNGPKEKDSSSSWLIGWKQGPAINALFYFVFDFPLGIWRIGFGSFSPCSLVSVCPYNVPHPCWRNI